MSIIPKENRPNVRNVGSSSRARGGWHRSTRGEGRVRFLEPYPLSLERPEVIEDLVLDRVCEAGIHESCETHGRSFRLDGIDTHKQDNERLDALLFLHARSATDAFPDILCVLAQDAEDLVRGDGRYAERHDTAEHEHLSHGVSPQWSSGIVILRRFLSNVKRKRTREGHLSVCHRVQVCSGEDGRSVASRGHSPQLAQSHHDYTYSQVEKMA